MSIKNNSSSSAMYFMYQAFCNEYAPRESKNCIKFVEYIYNGFCNEVCPNGILLIY